MTYVLNNADVLPVPGRSHGETRASKPGLMQRFYAALVVSRARSAARELRAATCSSTRQNSCWAATRPRRCRATSRCLSAAEFTPLRP